jgi:hypothetical protein
MDTDFIDLDLVKKFIEAVKSKDYEKIDQVREIIEEYEFDGQMLTFMPNCGMLHV